MFAAEPQREVREEGEEASPRVQLGLPTLIMTVVMAPFGCPSPFPLSPSAAAASVWEFLLVSSGCFQGCLGVFGVGVSHFLRVFKRFYEFA